MTKMAGGLDRGSMAGRMAWCAALLSATALTASCGGALPRAVEVRASDEPPLLRSIAHVGGRLSGLAVDGDIAYIGEGPDVIALRVDADGQLAIVNRTPLPEIVTHLAIAPEVDRLYAAAGDAVHAISIADGRPPALLDGVAVPLHPDANIVAQGSVVYARLGLSMPGQGRCIAAVSFSGTPTRGTLGPPVCATDLPADGWANDDRLTLGDGVLAAFAVHDWGVGVPDIALFDVRDPAQPRFRRSMDFDDDVLQAEVSGTRLWVLDEEGRSARAYDASNLDHDPVEVAEATMPFLNRIDRMFKAEGEIWLVAPTSIRAYDPNATGTPLPTKERWISGYYTASAPHGLMAASRHALLVLDADLLGVCRIPTDDAHIVGEMASWHAGGPIAGRLTAAGGQAFVPTFAGLTRFVYGWPAGLVRVGEVSFPPIVSGGETRDVSVGAFDADAEHFVGLQAERLAMVRVPFVGSPMPAATWTIPPVEGATDTKAVAVRVAAGRAAVLRPTDLHVVDLARPEAPVGHIADRWRTAHTLAIGPEWAAVLAGGYDRAGEAAWFAPHVVIVDVRSFPPTVLGELTLADRIGWNPVRIARDGNRLVVALSRPAGGTRAQPVRRAGEVVVIDATDPTAPAVIGRLAIEDEAGVDLRALAAADGLAIAGGMARPAPDPDAEPEWGPPPDRGRLWVIDISTPAQPVVRASHDVPGSPSNIAMDGRAVLVAAWDGGLLRFDLVLPGDVPAPVWRLALPWLAPGERPMRGQPVARRATALPRATPTP